MEPSPPAPAADTPHVQVLEDGYWKVRECDRMVGLRAPSERQLAVDQSIADLRGTRDLSHAGGAKAVSHEASFGGIQESLTPRLRTGAGGRFFTCSGRYRGHLVSALASHFGEIALV